MQPYAQSGEARIRAIKSRILTATYSRDFVGPAGPTTDRSSGILTDVAYARASGACCPAGTSVQAGQDVYTVGFYQFNPITAYDAARSAPVGVSLDNSGNADAYIVKYNSEGVGQWAARVASANEEAGNGITADKDGNVYITGVYDTNDNTNPVAFYNADGSIFTTLTNPAYSSAFIVKYNSAGVGQWAARIASTSTATLGNSIAVDKDGNICATGTYNDAVGGGAQVAVYNADGSLFQTLDNSGNADAFIVKYNSAGVGQWAARIAGVSNDRGTRITADKDGNIYATGYYDSSTVSIYNADGSVFQVLDNSGSNDVFVVKYNSAGVGQWAARIAGTSGGEGRGITADKDGNVYATGYYQSSPVSIYNADGSVFQVLDNSGNTDAFIVKYNSAGVGQWAARIAGTSDDNGNAIAADKDGNVYATGFYTSSPVSIYNANGSVFQVLDNSGGGDAFIVKYNSAGVGQWAARIAGTSTDSGIAITADKDGNVYTTGAYFSSPVSIYNAGGTIAQVLSNEGISDAFLAKYSSTGSVVWATHIAGTGFDIGNSVATPYFMA